MVNYHFSTVLPQSWILRYQVYVLVAGNICSPVTCSGVIIEDDSEIVQLPVTCERKRFKSDHLAEDMRHRQFTMSCYTIPRDQADYRLQQDSCSPWRGQQHLRLSELGVQL